MKGKGVSFIENVAGWHGKAPNHDEMVRGLEELRVKDEVPYGTMLARAQEFQKNIVEPRLDDKLPKYSRDYWWNADYVALLGARFALIVGENEVKSGQFALKNLASGEQVTVARAELPQRIQEQ